MLAARASADILPRFFDVAQVAGVNAASKTPAGLMMKIGCCSLHVLVVEQGTLAATADTRQYEQAMQ